MKLKHGINLKNKVCRINLFLLIAFMIHNSLLKKKDSKPSNFPHDCSFNAPNQTTLRRPKEGLKHKASSPKTLAPFSLSLGERGLRQFTLKLIFTLVGVVFSLSDCPLQ